jgi:hypothetical protein
MKQPSDRDIKALRRKYNELIAQAQAKCIGDFQAVRDYVFNQLSNLKGNDAFYQALETYIITRYNSMFLQLKTDIVENYNQAGIIETNFAENTMGERLRFEPALVAVLPESRPFKITNRILAEKSVLKRSRIMANQVTQAIADSFANGSSIQALQREIDIIMGFRNKDGRINEKAKALIVQGKFSHRNGHIYETYRIARTETMRMAHIRQYEIFEGIERDDKRLKLYAVLDSRTRWQSAAMHGQISDKRGRFKYPDGIYYRLGEQPKQWAINDRETTAVVFLDNADTAKELKAQETPELKDFKGFYENTKAVATALRNSVPVDKISTNYLKDNITADLRKHYVVAGQLNDTVKNLLGSETNELRLSFDNFVKNQAKHPDINYSLYSKVSRLINNYDKYYFNRGNLIIEKIYQGNNILIALKTTKNKAENYLLSMYMANHNKKQ